MENSLLDKIEKKYIPVSGGFELTWECNLNCRFCYQARKSGKELSAYEIKKILGEIAGLGCLFLSFTGGEPLLREDFWEIAEYAGAKHFALTLQTNGTLINGKFAKRIRKLNFLDVHISLLGGKAKTHDWFTRQDGSFDKVMESISILTGQKVRVVLKATLMKQNFSELSGINKIAEKFGCKVITSTCVSAKNNGDKSPFSFRMDDSQVKDFYKSIFNKSPEAKRKYMPNSREGTANCACGRTGFCINPIGEVYPCVGLPVPLGNLQNNNFKEIWNKGGMLQKLREPGISSLPACSKCELLNKCVRCKGMAYIEDGSIFSRSKEACRITNIVEEVVKNGKENLQEAGNQYKKDETIFFQL